MSDFSTEDLEHFVVRAKQAAYVGKGQKLLPYRLGSIDLQHVEGDWAYHDSYLGESDFIGQEIVYFRREPVWGMNYFGFILRDDLITAEKAGQVIQESLSRLYAEGRFLGGFSHEVGGYRYSDASDGDVRRFSGRERIFRGNEPVYGLVYHGGLLRR